MEKKKKEREKIGRVPYLFLESLFTWPPPVSLQGYLPHSFDQDQRY